MNIDSKVSIGIKDFVSLSKRITMTQPFGADCKEDNCGLAISPVFQHFHDNDSCDAN